MGLWSSKATCSKFLIINVHFYWMKKSDKVGFLHFPLQALQLLLLTLWPMRIWVIAFFTNQNTKCITFKYRFPLMAVVVLWDHALYSSNMHKDKPIKITIFCLEWAHTHNSTVIGRAACIGLRTIEWRIWKTNLLTWATLLHKFCTETDVWHSYPERSKDYLRTGMEWHWPAWLTADWKYGGSGSCKGCAVPLACDKSCPAVIWGVLQLWKRRIRK
jgi:hypothetical protein